MRVAFALDCCDREAMSFLATTSASVAKDVTLSSGSAGVSMATNFAASSPSGLFERSAAPAGQVSMLHGREISAELRFAIK